MEWAGSWLKTLRPGHVKTAAATCPCAPMCFANGRTVFTLVEVTTKSKPNTYLERFCSGGFIPPWREPVALSLRSDQAPPYESNSAAHLRIECFQRLGVYL